jgi:hypothetical protein
MLTASIGRAQLIPSALRPDSPPPPAAPAPRAAPELSRGDAPLDVPRVAFGAGGHLAFGSAPAVAVGVRLSAELATVRWAFGLEGRYDLPASAHTTQGALVRTSLAGVSILPCVRAQALWACGAVLLSRVEGDAMQGSQPGVNDGFFFLGLGGRVALHAGLPAQFALRVVAEVLVHPITYELSQNGSVLYKSSAVSMAVGPAVFRAF